MTPVAELAFAALAAALRWTVPFAVLWLILRGSSLSAAARHHVWLLLLSGLLLLPVAVALLPSYGVPRPVLPGPHASAAGTAGRDGIPSPRPTPLPVGQAEEGRVDTRSPGIARIGPVPGVEETTAHARARRSLLRAAWPWIWLGGVVGLLGFWIIGQLAVRSTARRSLIAPERHAAVLRECTRRMRIRRNVRLLQSEENLVPMTWGWWRPTVLLPAVSVGWNEARLRRVLLHELAHIARCDAPARSLARITCSLFWFHPAVWYAARRLRQEAEMACDDRVVELEGTPFAYAEDLLRIAQTLGSAPFAAPVLPMAGRTGLSRRIRALLESGRRRGLSRRLATYSAIGLIVLVCAVAVVRWADPSTKGEDPSGNWLRRSALEDGRSVWSMNCGSASEAICVAGTRQAIALLERSGRTGAVIAQRVSTGQVVMYAAVRDPGADEGDALPRVAPGSVAKLALAALWWESGWADSLTACPAETLLPSGRPLRNAGGFASGAVSAEDMLVTSCNTAAVSMAARLIGTHGARGFAHAFDRSGLTTSALRSPGGSAPWTVAFAGSIPPGEQPGANDSLLLSSLGMDGSSTTPLHLSQFLQAIGNGGRQLPAIPAVGGRDTSGAQHLMGQVAAARLQAAMLRVVAEGTAARTLPQLEWSRWTLGGKTGTVPSGADEPDGWFAGLAHGPDGRAEYTIVVLVERGGTGGRVPAGIAAEMTRLFARLSGDEL